MAYDVWTSTYTGVLTQNNTLFTATASVTQVKNLTGMVAGQKIYAEFTPTHVTGSSTYPSSFAAIDVGSVAAPVTFYWRYEPYPIDNVFSSNATPNPVSFHDTTYPGSVISLALDLVDNLLFVRIAGGNWNGSASVDPGVSSTGGYNMSAVAGSPWFVTCSCTSNLPGAWVCNFGQNPFSYAVPAGYGELLQASTPQTFFSQIMF